MKKLLIPALAVIIAAISAQPLHAYDDSDSYYEALDEAVKSGNRLLADSLLSAWKKSGIEPEELVFAEGRTAMRLGDIDRGDALLDSAETLAPKRLDFRVRHIREKFLAGRKQEAFAAMRRITAETAADTAAWAYFEEPIEGPVSDELAGAFGAILYHMKEEGMPMETLREIADTMAVLIPDAGATEAKLAFGTLLCQDGNFSEAISLFESALPTATEPRLSRLRLLLISSYMDTNEPDKREAMAIELLTSPYSDPAVLKAFNEYFLAEPDTVPYGQFQMTVLSMFADQPFLDNFAEMLRRPQNLLAYYFAYTNLTVDRDLSGITAETVDITYTDGDSTVTLPVIVWTMPEPREMIDCKYVAFVPDGDNHFRFITLEKTFPFGEEEEAEGNVYMVCEAVFTEQNVSYDHRNYGMRFGDSLPVADFARVAAHIVVDGPGPSIYSTFDEDGKSTLHIVE